MTLKDAVKTKLLARGWFCSSASFDHQIRALLRSMSPVATDIQLIRIGSPADGGYLIPDDLEDIRYCFSPGVANSSAFESDLASRGIESFMADYSVDGPATENSMFHFSKRYLGAFTDDVFITLGDWLQTSVSPEDGDLILQMDIEGSEYDVIFQTPEDIWKRFRIVTIEFHDVNAVFQPMGLKLLSLCMNKILRIFDVVHIHPNNGGGMIENGELQIPRMIEVTFLRKDRICNADRPRHFRTHSIGQTFLNSQPWNCPNAGSDSNLALESLTSLNDRFHGCRPQGSLPPEGSDEVETATHAACLGVQIVSSHWAIHWADRAVWRGPRCTHRIEFWRILGR